MRLMAAHCPSDIFAIVLESMEWLDSINLTAALQRLAKFLGSHAGERGAVLGSPVFQLLTGAWVDG